MRLTVSLDAAPDAHTEPLTSTRSLGDCLVAGKPLRDWQARILGQAGLDLIETEGDFQLRENACLTAEALREFANSSASCLRTSDAVLAYRPGGATETDEGKVVLVEGNTGQAICYPWQFLNLQEQLLKELANGEVHPEAEVHERATIDGILVLGAGSKILPGVYIEGVAVIGENCKIGPNAYLRGMNTIGDGCHIGQAVEIKNSIIYGKTAMGHLSYCGDSVVGSGVNFGAGTIVSNFRHDGKNHRSMIGDRLVDTGRRKFGAIIGDGVHTGIHTGIYPGRKLWPNTTTRPGENVQRDLHPQGIC